MTKRYVWMYYETDGDAGYYHIRLFSTARRALAYQQQRHDAYAHVARIEINQREAA